MLVSAFSGVDEMRNAYKHAVDEKYRFFSYGDCCLLFRNDKVREQYAAEYEYDTDHMRTK